jgi:hypothetical protein
MIVGQPCRLRMLSEALQHIVSHPEKEKVWFTRPSAIYDHCAALPAEQISARPAGTIADDLRIARRRSVQRNRRMSTSREYRTRAPQQKASLIKKLL